MEIIKTSTLIVGAGQAGLAASYYLNLNGHDHIVLDRSDKPADMWRNRTWDSLTFVTPNWTCKMPGVELNGKSRDGFMPRKEIIEFFEDYILKFRLPVKYKTEVISVVRSVDGDYRIKTNGPDYIAKNVVIASGFFQHPKKPGFALKIAADIHQLHSTQYRNPRSVPDGAVLVVGSGQSGCQIAEELLRAGRKVFLSIGRAGRVPRRYRGKDIIEWLDKVGLFDLTVEQLPPGLGKFDGIPHLSGFDGGHTINLHQFARDGMRLLGHVIDADQNVISLKPDLYKSVEEVDQFEVDATMMIDEYIAKAKLEVPKEIIPQYRDAYQQEIIECLDLTKEKISTIIWCIGYTFDYSMVRLPVFDQDGFPIQSRGVTNETGLYFVGMPWMPTERSGTLFGIGDAAKYIASHITERSQV
jgi:putative flavoprotein involved in K+ transport